jgi:glycosyltransferase involved in cell wall biosynthesis
MSEHSLKIAILSPHTTHMGDTRSMPNLAKGLSELGHKVDLLQSWREWSDVSDSDPQSGVRVVSLRTRWFAPVLPNVSFISSWASYRIALAVLALAMMPGLIWYLLRAKPDVLIVRMATVPTILVVKLLRFRTRVLVSTGGIPQPSRFRNFLWPLVYTRADGVVASAPGVKQVICQMSGIDEQEIELVWDPVLDDELIVAGRLSAEHKWFVDDGPPVVMSLGRLTRQKDYLTLIRAFGKASDKVNARLVIFGDGEQKTMLDDEVARLNLSDSVDLPGFTSLPYAHLSSCAIFVLSSIWEGSSHSLIEAQGLGISSITTDCPSGQREIAMDGETAKIVPVGEVDAMASAIESLLNDSEGANRLSKNALENADRFKVGPVSRQWEKLLVELVGKK